MILLVHHIDVRTAFLNGNLEEEVYIAQPKSFNAANPGFVCKLNKSIYGLRQAFRVWNKKFNDFINSCGLRKLESDNYYVYKSTKSDLYVAI